MRIVPRRGWPSSTTFTPASCAPSAVLAMLVKVLDATDLRPSRLASAR
jgi:hypothetical protein